MQSVNESARYVARVPERFAVYVGDGRYVSSVSASAIPGYDGHGFVHFAGLDRCLSLARHEAVTACHASRRAGVPAWIVRHPVGALA